MLVENSPNLNGVPSQITERPIDEAAEKEAETRPKKDKRFLNSITKHQLATTRCFMVSTCFTFVLLTIYLIVEIALRKSTGANEKPEFGLSILLIGISFSNIITMTLFNSYVRKDVLGCCRK